MLPRLIPLEHALQLSREARKTNDKSKIRQAETTKRYTHTERDNKRGRDTEKRHTDRQRETESDRERQRETHREDRGRGRHTEGETQRERHRERERLHFALIHTPSILLRV